MPTLPEASKPLSLLASGLPLSSTPWAVAVALPVLIGAAGTIHYASLQRLTRVLVDTMADVKISHYAMLYDVLKGRTFTILRCLDEAHELGAHIEICDIIAHPDLRPAVFGPEMRRQNRKGQAGPGRQCLSLAIRSPEGRGGN
ncbi:hypothetical protein B0H14DRAFT_2566507 [Mycena olivaceomarginata]|nr:hypothetical protein B0H14DRAFT_2566507 [Mycena olivaceomarginata]